MIRPMVAVPFDPGPPLLIKLGSPSTFSAAQVKRPCTAVPSLSYTFRDSYLASVTGKVVYLFGSEVSQGGGRELCPVAFRRHCDGEEVASPDERKETHVACLGTD